MRGDILSGVVSPNKVGMKVTRKGGGAGVTLLSQHRPPFSCGSYVLAPPVPVKSNQGEKRRWERVPKPETKVVMRISYVVNEKEVRSALGILEQAWLQGYLKLARTKAREVEKGGAA